MPRLLSPFAAVALCALAGCHTLFGVGSDVYSPSYLERPAWGGSRVDTPEGVLDYLTAYPDEVSLVAYWTDAPERGVYHGADVPRPLASTVKVVVLAEYARQVAAGALDPAERVPLDSLAVYDAPLTASGHRPALRWLRAAGRVRGGAVALEDVARVMVRHSSNPATDYLIARLGRSAVLEAPRRLGLGGADAPLPVSGLFGQWDAAGTPVQADEAFEWAARVRAGGGLRRLAPTANVLRLSYVEQRRNARTLPAGTALGYADALARARAGTLVSDSVSAHVLEVLNWPMRDGWATAFDAFGFKGGSVPGVMTMAAVGRPSGDARGPAGGRDLEAGVVVAVFVEGLPMGVWGEWEATGALFGFTTRLMTDPAFFERARTAFATAAPPSRPR